MFTIIFLSGSALFYPLTTEEAQSNEAALSEAGLTNLAKVYNSRIRICFLRNFV